MAFSSRRAPRLSAACRAALRYAAELAYTLSPDDVSAASLAQREAFSDLGAETLQEWIDAGDWPSLRSAHFARLRERLRRRMEHELVDGKMRQIRDMEALLDQGMALMEDEEMLPRMGFEGMAQTLMRLGDCLNKTRGRVMRDLLNEVNPGASVESEGTATPLLSEHEARAAARAVVMARQSQIKLPAPGKTVQATHVR